MKIFINGRFLTQRRTGVQRYALETLLAIDAQMTRSPASSRFRVTLLAPRGTPAPPLSCIQFETPGPFSGQLWEQLTLPAVCGDALLVNFGMTGPLFKSNQVVTLHDASVYAVPEAYGRTFRRWYRFALPILAHRSRYLMTVSEFSRRELIRYLGPVGERAKVTGEGWQHATHAAADSTILDSLELRARPYFLAVGSMASYKNLSLIARAIELVEEQLHFDVVVVGPCDRAVFSASSLVCGSRIKHAGYVTDAELRALYENATAFVHASRYEGFGIPPLEAMALGCPVLTSNAAALPEVCGDAALYFDPEDADQLAQRVRLVLTDELQRATLVAKGLRQARRHSWTATARHFVTLFEEHERAMLPAQADVARIATEQQYQNRIGP